MLFTILGFALLASAFTANKFLLREISPIFFVAIRMSLSGIILIGYYLRKRSKSLRLSHLKVDFKILFIICICTTLIPSFLKAYALKQLISSEAVLIGSLDPFITAIYAYFLFTERLTFRKLIGIMIGFASIMILISAKNPIYDAAFSIKLFSLPVVCALLAVIIGRYGWIMTQDLIKKERYQPAEINGISMISSGLIALVASFFMNEIAPLQICLSKQVVIPLIYTVVIGNLIAYTIYAYSLKRHPVTLVSFLGFSVPIFSHFFGYIALGEPLSWKFFVATSCACFGLLLYSKKSWALLPQKVPK